MMFTTYNTTYTLDDIGDGGFMISGHQRFCPAPVRVTIDCEIVVGKCVTFAYAEPATYPGRWEGRHITTTPVVSIGD
jgi:hypothetical protein